MPIKMVLLDGEGNCLECLQNGVLTSAKRAIKICQTSTKRPEDMPKMSTEHRNVLETTGNSSELLRKSVRIVLETSTIHDPRDRNVSETFSKCLRNVPGNVLTMCSKLRQNFR